MILWWRPQEAARRIIAETQLIRLSIEDQRLFAHAVLYPPKPSDALQRAAMVPAALIGRLAVSFSFQGQHLGGALVIDASVCAARADPAIFAIVADAKDKSADRFYRTSDSNAL